MNYMRSFHFSFCCLMGLASIACFARINDNRYLPFYDRPFITVEDLYSHAGANLFVVTAHDAYNYDQEYVGLFELFGEYDQGKLAKAIAASGCPNPLKTEWQGAIIPWRVFGKLQGQGIEIAYQQQITDHIWLGFDTFAIHMNSWAEFALQQDKVSGIRIKPSDVSELEELRRCMHNSIGLCSDNCQNSGLSDIDAYVRFGKVWDHYLKFRTILGGLRLGVLLPTARKHDWNCPAWIPIGGNGHWGIYGSLEAEFEVKEDMRVGFLMRLTKRFPRTFTQRAPLLNEPEIFGAICVPLRIDPGFTYVGSPYISLEHIRDGLGIRAFYTLAKHEHDSFNYSGDPKCKPNIANLEKYSSWAADYFSLNVFYDFGKVRVCRDVSPILTFNWDIPAAILVAEKVARTHKISLGVELAF